MRYAFAIFAVLLGTSINHTHAADDLKPIADVLPNDTIFIGVGRVSDALGSKLFSSLPMLDQIKRGVKELEGEFRIDFRGVDYVGMGVVFPKELSQEDVQWFVNDVFGIRNEKRGKVESKGEDKKDDCDVEPKEKKKVFPIGFGFARFKKAVDARALLKKMSAAGKGDDAPEGWTIRVETRERKIGKYVLLVTVVKESRDDDPKRSFTYERMAILQVDTKTVLFGSGSRLAAAIDQARGKGSISQILRATKPTMGFAAVSLKERPKIRKAVAQAYEKLPLGLRLQLGEVPEVLDKVTLEATFDESKPLAKITMTAINAKGVGTLETAAKAGVQHAQGAVGLLDLTLSMVSARMSMREKQLIENLMKHIKPRLEAMVKGMKVTKSGKSVTLSVPNPGLFKLMTALKPDVEKIIKDVEKQGGRIQMMHQLKNFGIAVHNYADVHRGAMPIAKTQKEMFTKGKPHHSWRTALLPYLEELGLYRKLKLKEAWDSKHNTRFHKTAIKVLAVPGTKDATKTRIRVFSGPGTPMTSGVTLQQIASADGTSNTLLAFLAAPRHAVPWMKPGGVKFDPKKPEDAIKALGKIPPQGVPVLLCDGSARMILPGADAKEFAKLVVYNDGQPVDWDKLAPRRRGAGKEKGE